MIPLRKDNAAEYASWLASKKTELDAHFQSHLDKKQKDWVSQANRESLQSFLFPTSWGKCA